jgi:hypothetical protein
MNFSPKVTRLLTNFFGAYLLAFLCFSPSYSSAQTVVEPVETVVSDVELPEIVAASVVKFASKELGILEADLQVSQATKEEWSDGCLGLPKPDELCTEALVAGWRVVVLAKDELSYIYRSDELGLNIRQEPTEIFEDSPALSDADKEKFLKAISADLRIPFRKLRIVEVQPASFDSCFGIYRPSQMCIQIASTGWRAVVASEKKAWVYNLKAGGDIIKNSTASPSRWELVPSFIPTENIQPLGEGVVFQSITSGDLTGNVTQIVLTNDGLITKYTSGPTIKTKPVILKKLTRFQLHRFERLLEILRFPNLNGIAYITEAAFADYPTTYLQGVGGTTQYIDLEVKNMPRALRLLVKIWGRLQR